MPEPVTIIDVRTGEVTTTTTEVPGVLAPPAVAVRDVDEIAAIAAAAAAVADFLASKPGFSGALAAALDRLGTAAGSIQAQADAIVASANATGPGTITAAVALLAGTVRSNTLANCASDCTTAFHALGTSLETMRTGHAVEAAAMKDEAAYLRRTIQVLASSLGLPLGAGGALGPQGQGGK